jgi:hypothetical protein
MKMDGLRMRDRAGILLVLAIVSLTYLAAAAVIINKR